jgi:hypothetical protein
MNAPNGILAQLVATHEALASAGIPHGLIGGLDYDDARAILLAQSEKIDETLLPAACRRRKTLDRLELIRKK